MLRQIVALSKERSLAGYGVHIRLLSRGDSAVVRLRLTPLLVVAVIAGGVGFLAGACFSPSNGFSREKAARDQRQVASIFRKAENATKIYSYDYLDENRLCDFTGAELLCPLSRALENIPEDSTDGSLHQMDATYAHALSLALIDHCGGKGVTALLAMYKSRTGKAVKGRIAEALAERRCSGVVPTLLAGLRGENNVWVLQLVDVALSRLTFEKGYFSQHGWTFKAEWKGVYDYWRRLIHGDHLAIQAARRTGASSM